MLACLSLLVLAISEHCARAQETVFGDHFQPTTLTDFDDLHSLNVPFGSLTLAQRRGLRSLDVAAVHWFGDNEAESAETGDGRATSQAAAALWYFSRRVDNGYDTIHSQRAAAAPPRSLVVPQFTRFAQDHRQDGVGFVYGYRELGVWDQSGFNTDGVLRMRSTTITENWVTGPQLGVAAFKRYGPLSFYAHGLVVAGLNDGTVQQSNRIGEELVPGALNRPLYANPVDSEYAESHDDLVPTSLFWAETGLQLTENTSVKLAWSALFVDNILFADDRTRYFLPDMGLRDPGNQSLFYQTFFCGVEMVR